ncbi:hypothetical protein UY3_05270 [Chelonia mydas]|uniref:Uncharacterized protein n=1 Tax=Chelonia mydas TaxID=8469 RepID=M7BI15_CHEMY|nr:hypothetical protein UY3_05270 [Chelonia mydas]
MVLWVSTGTRGSTTWSVSGHSDENVRPTDPLLGGLEREADGTSEAPATERARTRGCVGSHCAHWYRCGTDGPGCSAWSMERRLRAEPGLTNNLPLPRDQEEWRCQERRRPQYRDLDAEDRYRL